MLAVLKPEAWPLWLGEKPAEPVEPKVLLKPFPGGDDLPSGERGSAMAGIITRA